MCHTRYLNVYVIRLKEGASFNEDAQTLGKMLGYREAQCLQSPKPGGSNVTPLGREP